MERNNRLIQEYIHDPYFTKAKMHDPSVCEKCRVVFHNGVFNWLEDIPPRSREDDLSGMQTDNGQLRRWDGLP